MKAEIRSTSRSCPRGGRIRIAGIVLAVLTAATVSNRAMAAWGDATGDPGHVGLVLEAGAEAGGDNLVDVIYRDGYRQHIKAGNGIELGGGVHFRPVGFPVDFAATVGYKFVRTASYDTDLGVDRVVIKLTGTVPLGNHFWVMAGPVWHTGVKLNGDGYIPDVNFDDAVGGTVGIGWRWFGLTYTSIKYKGQFDGSVDASSGGLTFAWKF